MARRRTYTYHVPIRYPDQFHANSVMTYTGSLREHVSFVGPEVEVWADALSYMPQRRLAAAWLKAHRYSLRKTEENI